MKKLLSLLLICTLLLSISTFGITSAGAKRANKVVVPAKGYTPQKGDFVFFSYGHVGIVYKVSGKTITTIEGNINGTNCRNTKVGKRTWKTTDKKITYYINASSKVKRSVAKKAADKAYKAIGKNGKYICGHTKSWKGGIVEWDSIFCAYAMEQANIKPDVFKWSASISTWLENAKKLK